jgi:hypothetical protein
LEGLILIRVYIVTYRKDEALNACLSSLWASAKQPEDIAVTVISNWPEVEIAPENQRSALRVLVNQTRHRNSWGFLARDWNFALVDAFQTWRNEPGTQWCVLAQNDIETWVDGWDEYLRNCTQYDLISQPKGDQVVALNIEAVRTVGLFDERFSTLHFHEFDYFYRAILALGSRASINDTHGDPKAASWNPVGNVLTLTASSGTDEDEDSLFHSPKSHREMLNLLRHKWRLSPSENVEDRQRFVRLRRGSRPPREINFYPFFWDGFDRSDLFLTEYKMRDALTVRSVVASARARAPKGLRGLWRRWRRYLPSIKS